MTIIHKGYFTIEQLEVDVRGEKKKREKLILPSAVGAIVKAGEKFGFVKQYRPIVAKNTLEIVAGVLDKGLDEVSTLHEELLEEMSIKKEEILRTEYITNYFMGISYSDALLYLFLVEVDEQPSKKIVDNDVEEVVWLTLREIEEKLSSHEIFDAKTFACCQYILNNFRAAEPPTD